MEGSIKMGVPVVMVIAWFSNPTWENSLDPEPGIETTKWLVLLYLKLLRLNCNILNTSENASYVVLKICNFCFIFTTL